MSIFGGIREKHTNISARVTLNTADNQWELLSGMLKLKMKIDITNKALTIYGTLMNFPLHIDEIKKILGEARLTKTAYNHIYTWDDAGICGYSEKGEAVESLELFIKSEEYDFSPGNTYNTDLLVDNCSYEDYYHQNVTHFKKNSKKLKIRSFVVGDVSIYYYIDGKEIRSISIQKHIEPPAKVYSDKYKYKEIEGEKIEFTDFNFKLAVIQQLMYNKKLIEPAFDLYDFVDNYKEREIDIEEEGYGFIPEVIEYFKNLEIDKKYAEEIVEIYQDGGDDIYGNVLRFWDGEDDVFNIRDFGDIKHFKNLKKMTIFCTDNIEEIKSYLNQYNIEVK